VISHAFTLMSICLVFQLLLKVPIGFALGSSSLLYIFLTDAPLSIVAQYLTSYINSFTLLAIPLFVLAGEFMNRGGITQRLVRLANAMVGFIAAGLAHVTVLTNIFMAGISGSSSADAAATALILVPEMKKQGYPLAYASALSAAAATIGPIIPPSIHMVLLGAINEISIGRLLVGGILPGLLMGGSMMVYTVLIAKKRNFPKGTPTSFREFLAALRGAFLPLLTPVIIIVGMTTGICTPTEAAALAAIYTFVLGFFVYGEIGKQDIVQALLNTVKVTSNIMIIVGFAGVFGWILISEQVSNLLIDSMAAFTTSPIILLIMINLLLLFMGCFLSTTSLIVIFSPLFFPLIQKYGIDPIHFGVAMMLNLEIGQLTPPVGITSFVVMDITKTPAAPFFKEMIPFIIGLVVVLLLTTYVPGVVLLIPNLIFGKI
jgi:tripartite ATP-independent transporter DctM subunit